MLENNLENIFENVVNVNESWAFQCAKLANVVPHIKLV